MGKVEISGRYCKEAIDVYPKGLPLSVEADPEGRLAVPTILGAGVNECLDLSELTYLLDWHHLAS